MDEKKKRQLAERRRRERIKKKKQDVMTILLCLVVIIVELILIIVIKPERSETPNPETSNSDTSSEESKELTFDEILESIKVKDSSCLLGGSLLPNQFVAGYDEFDISVSYTSGSPDTSVVGEYEIGITVRDNKSSRKANYTVSYTVLNIKSYHHVSLGSDTIKYSDIVLDNSINASLSLDLSTIDCSKSGVYEVVVTVGMLKYNCRIEIG